MWDILKKLNRMFTRKHRIALLVLFGLMVVGALLEAVGLGLLPAFVLASVEPQRFMDHELAGPIIERLNLTTPRRLLMGGSAVLLFVFTIKSLYQCFLFYALARFIWNRQVQLGHSLFSAYMGVPYEFLLRHNSAELKRNVFSETVMVTGHVIRALLGIAMHAILALVVTSVLFVAQPMAAVTGITILGTAGGVFLWLTRFRVARSGQRRQAASRALIQTGEEAFNLFRDARVLGKESFFCDRYLVIARKHAMAMRTKYVVGRISQPMLELIAVGAILGVAVLLLFRGHDVASIAPMLALFAAALLRLRFSANHLAVSYNELRHNAPAVEVVYEHLAELGACPVGTIRQRDAATSVLRLTDRITVENVTYAYPSTDSDVLQNIDLVIPKGKAVAFVGRTGSGKSTLVDVLLGLLTPQSGCLKVDGTDIRSDPGAWRRNLGYVPQTIRLMDDTIRNNMALGVPADAIDEQRLEQAVCTAQLKEMLDALPAGLDTVVGEQGVRLSGGERQRIAIARALYRNPDVLVLDEATSDLDNTTEKALMEAITETSGGEKTLITIAHRLSTVQSCDCLYLLEAGSIVDSGTYNELLGKNAVFKHMAETDGGQSA